MELLILIALATNWLLVNPVYQYMLDRFNLNIKPFNCIYCMSFWLALIATVLVGGESVVVMVLMPSAASFLAAFVSRLHDSLPVRIK